VSDPGLTPDGPQPGSTKRTKIRRIPDRAVTSPTVRDEVLDAGLVAHVAVIDAGQPFVVPVAYARSGKEVLFHGSSASRLFKTLADGQPTCLSVTLLDGLVLARSAFESSMNYRSVMVIGSPRLLEGDEKAEALRRISDHLLPGRWSDIRPPSDQESKATIVLALSLDECSVKVRTGNPEDVPEDLVDPNFAQVWGGTVPLTESFGTAVPDEFSGGIQAPSYIETWTRS
jgi:nitroimidazol reductase NimA-like FMN-containing flavoprotein (pyridoxamine 5'-phosphate oxidase superfamily)